MGVERGSCSICPWKCVKQSCAELPFHLVYWQHPNLMQKHLLPGFLIPDFSVFFADSLHFADIYILNYSGYIFGSSTQTLLHKHDLCTNNFDTYHFSLDLTIKSQTHMSLPVEWRTLNLYVQWHLQPNTYSSRLMTFFLKLSSHLVILISLMGILSFCCSGQNL
jgi:hypothetical protein